MAESGSWEALDTTVLPAPWKLETLTETETNKLKQFLEAVKEWRKPEEHQLLCLRWLRARAWDVDKAVDMYIKHQKWRARNRVDMILEEYPKSPYFKILSENYPTSHTDPKLDYPLRTRDGYHFLMEKMGSIGPDLASLFPLEELVRFHIWSNEVAMQERLKIMDEMGGEVFAPTFAFEDLNGIGLSHMKGATVGVLKEFTKIDSENYPEGLRKVIIVNVPSVFNMIWKVVQYFFDERQKSKFEFLPYGSDPIPVLEKYVHPDFIPKSYGGNLDWGLPKAEMTEEMRAMIPEPAKRDWEKAHVSRGGNFEHCIQASEGAKILWEFRTEGYDIGFGLKLREGPKDYTELTEIERVDSHKAAVHGVWTAEKAGTYALFWDNKYSWAHGKDLKYIVTLDDSGASCASPAQEAGSPTDSPGKKKKKKGK